MLECVVRTGLQMLFEIYFKWLVNLVQEHVQEQVLKRRRFKNPEHPRDRSTKSLQQQVVFLQDVRLIQQECWFDIGCIFLDSCQYDTEKVLI